MRSVSQIKKPRIGMHVGVRRTDGRELFGRVLEARRDVRGHEWFALDNGAFRPARGDVLFFYSPKPKDTRPKRGASLQDAQTIAKLRKERTRFGVLALVLAALLAATLALAFA